jgi:CRISPR/Cas system CMR subunit Cmr6 (Cas7 group RAMP superfamily)
LAYAQHILQNIHEYSTLAETMALKKTNTQHSKTDSLEQLYIHTLHHNGNLIDEQPNGDPKPLFQLAIDTKSDVTTCS